MGDAAFANPDLYSYLEEENFSYAIRLQSNAILQKHIAPLLTRPVGRPSRAPKVFYASFSYQAASWQRTRRVVAKVEWHAGELFARVGFIVTNLNWQPRKVVKFYNHRGTAEQWIKEGKHAIHWTRLSCHDFKDSAVRLQLFALAYNLSNLMRRLILPPKVKHWMRSMTCILSRENGLRTCHGVARRAKTDDILGETLDVLTLLRQCPAAPVDIETRMHPATQHPGTLRRI